MNKYLLIFFLLFSQQVVACEIPLGTYEAITESEYSLKIKLLDSKIFHLVHKNWFAGDHEMEEEHIYKGRWHCTDKLITLEYTTETIEGNYQKRSLKEFNINKSTNVIVFKRGKGNKSLIAGWEFWPDDFLNEAFK